MIASFRHKGIERFFKAGHTAGIQASHAKKLSRQLRRLDDAESPQDMNLPGWNLHPLRGQLKRHWAITVSGNWRLTFRFNGNHAEQVDYQDYH